ncbi:unnamed protein product [Chondrus crispus]|uniref:Uncharacterized protein n=1 Tax=Chondrus crispus TaxID=2769 RepID=R7QPT5_CHOCR|nr:unnamed protein product [Chondrus crispus]CDF39410.1 unnamed protein product [Chondrus crispus]|eukprot:XP_005719321.1 unnamed protein product [Chondrus crispus]
MKFSLAICLLACLLAVVAAAPAQPRLPKLREATRQNFECLHRAPPGLEFCCFGVPPGYPPCEGISF